MLISLLFADGFFDAGMLLQALKAKNEQKELSPAEKAAEARRNIGRKLTLSDY